MKSTNILFMLMIFIITACSPEDRFIIKGTVPSRWNAEKVELILLDGNLDDSIVIGNSRIKNNKFRINGSVMHPDYVVLRFNNEKSVHLFLENTTIRVDFPAEAGNPVIKGSRLNDLLSGFNTRFAPYRSQLRQVRDDIVTARAGEQDNPAFLARKRMTMDTIIGDMVKCQEKFIAQYPNTLVTAYILRMSKTDLEISFVHSVYNNFDDNIKNSSIGKSLKKQIEAKEKTALGNSFIDIQLENINGEILTVSELMKDQDYLLLDFWASWCGPCRHENSNILKINDQYESKGLQIVGISLDVKKENWQKAVEEDHISWEQLSDLKGWDSPLVATYGIEGIPYTVLIDKEGKIVAEGLRGEKLREKLDEVFNDQSRNCYDTINNTF